MRGYEGLVDRVLSQKDKEGTKDMAALFDTAFIGGVHAVSSVMPNVEPGVVIPALVAAGMRVMFAIDPETGEALLRSLVEHYASNAKAQAEGREEAIGGRENITLSVNFAKAAAAFFATEKGEAA